MNKGYVNFIGFIGALSLLLIIALVAKKGLDRDKEFKKGCVKTNYYSVGKAGQFRIVYDCSEAVKDES